MEIEEEIRRLVEEIDELIFLGFSPEPEFRRASELLRELDEVGVHDYD